MAGEGVVARPAEGRVSTGNLSLDRMLEGGLVPHRPYLIVGPSGTGKTTLGIQFLCEGVRRRERVLLVTLEEPPNEARVNHRGLEPELSRVEVFDAIPDIMRYERAPFKDIASVRTAIPFSQVPFRIRQSPELTSVEVTITALEQMLRTEVIRRGYTRLVIDSLTALQYFCMKGFDPVSGAQSFLRFLSDLRVTTLLTVEAPLEDIETPERMLARGEIRLFRWELDGQTVRAIGVEKFRGSSHDVRLHPYRIGPQGLDINLDVTISRDTRQIIEPLVPRMPAPAEAAPVTPLVSPVTPLMDEVRDLILLGADVAPARSEIELALAATNQGHPEEAQAHLSRVTSLVMRLVDQLSHGPGAKPPEDPTAVGAYQRVRARVDAVRTGVPPTSLPAPSVLQVQLGALLSLLPPPPPPPEAVPAAAPAAPPPSPPPPAEAVAPPTPAAPPSTLPPPQEVAAPPVLAETAPTVLPVREVVAPPPQPAAPPEMPVAEPSPPTPDSVPTPRARPGRGLPAPPKPRPPPLTVRTQKPAAAPSTRGGASKAGPPPLPTTSVPAWLSAPTPPLEVPARSTATAPSHPTGPAPSAQAPARPSGGATKRRRKAPAGAPRRGGGHARVAAATAAEPTGPSAPAGPGPEREPPSPSKPRRRAARKRKAPPVVSVSVEPIPPGVFGNPTDESKPSDDADPPAAPEG